MNEAPEQDETARHQGSGGDASGNATRLTSISNFDEHLCRIARLTASIFEVPMAVIGQEEQGRLTVGASVGLDARAASVATRFCNHVRHTGEPLVVEDATLDNRFAHDRLVTDEPRIRFYAGVPFVRETGGPVATLSILDTRPRRVDSSDLAVLQQLSALIQPGSSTQKPIDTMDSVSDADDALHRSESLYHSVIDAMNEGIIVQDRTGAVVGHNRAAERVLGLSADQLLGRTSIDPQWHAVAADGRPFPGGEHPPMVTLQTGKRCKNVVMGVHTPDGLLRWLCVTSNPLFTAAGRLWGVGSVFADITDRRAVELAKSEFLSVVSHELRTPLTAIRGALGLLTSHRLSPESAQGRQLLAVAEDNSIQLTRLISDILDLERIEAGHVDLAHQLTSVASLLEAAREAIATIAVSHRVRIDISESTEDLLVLVDRDRIAQVLANLLSNAIKFSEPDSTVRLSARRHGETIEISVTDDGRGIPAEKLERIFDRFEQLDASDSRDRGGTGIGLSICRNLVEHHGGRIWATSIQGEGATFTFALPEVQAERPGGKPLDPEPAGATR